MNKVFVLVRYGTIKTKIKYSLLLKFIKKNGYKLIEIDTQLNEKIGRYSTNEAFEFSGYRAGFEKGICTGKNRFIFINDTFLKSHISLYSFYILIIFNSYKYIPNTIYGIHNKSNLGAYVSTWIFMIQVEGECAKKFSMYDYEIPFNKFFGSKYELLDLNFKNTMLDWLMPKNIFRGWYKTGPNMYLNFKDYKRKIYTIYSEYDLYKRFISFGFTVVPVNHQLIAKVLGLINKVNFFCLKIKYRIFCK